MQVLTATTRKDLFQLSSTGVSSLISFSTISFNFGHPDFTFQYPQNSAKTLTTSGSCSSVHSTTGAPPIGIPYTRYTSSTVISREDFGRCKDRSDELKFLTNSYGNGFSFCGMSSCRRDPKPNSTMACCFLISCGSLDAIPLKNRIINCGVCLRFSFLSSGFGLATTKDFGFSSSTTSMTSSETTICLLLVALWKKEKI